MMNTKPASGRNAVDRSKDIDQIVADRFLEAIARGTTPEFIDTEIKAANGRMLIGTMLSTHMPPNYAALAAKFLALSTYCEGRPPLVKHAGALREAGRICAIMVTLYGSTADKERMVEVALTDPLERQALTAKLLRVSLLPKDDVDDLVPQTVRRAIWSDPTDDVLNRTMTRARLIHAAMSQGNGAEACKAAAELGRDVLAVFLQKESAPEKLPIRRKLAAVMRALADAGAFKGTNIILMLNAAFQADEAAIYAQGSDPGDRVTGH